MIKLRKNSSRCPKCKGVLIRRIGNRQTFGQQMKMEFLCSACGSYYERQLNNNQNINKVDSETPARHASQGIAGGSSE